MLKDNKERGKREKDEEKKINESSGRGNKKGKRVVGETSPSGQSEKNGGKKKRTKEKKESEERGEEWKNIDIIDDILGVIKMI